MPLRLSSAGRTRVMGGASNSLRPPMIVFGCSSFPQMSKGVCDILGITEGNLAINHPTNKETDVEINEFVRSKEVFIISSGSCEDINNTIMELLIVIYACKTNSARKIIAVIPYLPYSRQCKMRKRGCITAKLVAKLLCNAGVNHLITMDLHHKEIQAFFDCSVDNLRASPFIIQYILDSIPSYQNAVIIAKSPDATRRASSYAERLQLDIAVIHGEEKNEGEEYSDDGRSSPPPSCSFSQQIFCFDYPGTVPQTVPKVKPPIKVVGDVSGKTAIFVDDMIDEARTFIDAARLLKLHGATNCYVMVTHGILSGQAPEELAECEEIDEVVVCNTTPIGDKTVRCPKLKVIDVSIMIAEAIRRIHNGESMAHLYQNIRGDD